MKNSRLKYILSAVSLLLVTALVVLIPYGYNYVNDSIKEGQIYNDGAFSYSDGKNAVSYDEIMQLFKSDPVWINEQPKTIDADIFNEIYSAIQTLSSAIEGNDYLTELTEYPLDNNDGRLSYCTASKVSGVVDEEPMTVNLMTAELSYSDDSSIIEVIVMYNRDNLKVYEYICDFNVAEVPKEYDITEAEVDKEVYDFAKSKLAQYLETQTDSLMLDMSYDIYRQSIFVFGESYNTNSLENINYY